MPQYEIIRHYEKCDVHVVNAKSEAEARWRVLNRGAGFKNSFDSEDTLIEIKVINPEFEEVLDDEV